MTREELERRLEEAEKQNLDLLDEIKRLKENLQRWDEPDEPDIPDIPEKFESPVVWAMDSKLDVFYYGISPYNESSFNAFHTKEMAQEFAEKCKLIAMMLHCKWFLCRDYQPDFNNGWAEKWTIAFNHGKEKFNAVVSKQIEWSTIYFDTEEAALKCADWMNEHWKEGEE